MRGRWLVTGGCGFLGSHLAARLLADGTDVVVLDDLSRGGSRENLRWLEERAAAPGAGRFTHGPVDVRGAADVDAAFERHGEGLAAVAHLAGQVAMTRSIEDPRADFEVNAHGTLNVLESVRRRAPGAALLFSSTNKVYGDLGRLRHVETATRWTLPDFPEGLDESQPLEFHSPYGCSKGAADQYVLDYHRIYGLRTVVFRHGSMYGGRQHPTYDQGWVGWFCERALGAKRGPLAEPFTISGDGKQVRDLLHADDAVECYVAAAERAGECAGEVFNLGGGMQNSLSLLELFAWLEAELGVKLAYRRIAPRASDQRVFVADSRKARRRLGWAPRIAVREGLRRLLGQPGAPA
ncbi:MAG: GDP-mannose 4,6-dehydratase [Planctomycetales bacterium]|nr:GDP-mannose 4,6-dehydratase [Planctomycetales bacterium]